MNDLEWNCYRKLLQGDWTKIKNKKLYVHVCCFGLVVGTCQVIGWKNSSDNTFIWWRDYVHKAQVEEIVTLCSSEAAAQCIVITPVCLCVFVYGSVTTITRNACIDPRQTGFAGKGSDHLLLIKFWPAHAPRKRVCGGVKILAPLYYRQRAVFASPPSAFSFVYFFFCLVCLCCYVFFPSSTQYISYIYDMM